MILIVPIVLLLAACASADRPQSSRGAEEARGPLAAGWVRDTVAGLEIAGPGAFTVRTFPLPEDVESLESYRASSERDTAQITVTRSVSRPGRMPTARASAQGSVGALAASGAEGVRHEHRDTTVSGVPAVHTVWYARAGDHAMRGELLTFVRERTWWQVAATGVASPGTETTARTVIGSVRIVE